jgi:hypothetical protein
LLIRPSPRLAAVLPAFVGAVETATSARLSFGVAGVGFCRAASTYTVGE